MRTALALLLLMACLPGCTTSGVAAGPSSTWIAKNGGVVTDTTSHRVAEIASRFTGVVEQPLHVRVLSSKAPSAFAWPSGDIFLTDAIVSILTDDEIAAVIAHELGHIISDRSSHSGSALTGTHEHFHTEMLADDVGIRLLNATSTPQGSLRSALHKVLSFQQIRGQHSPSLSARIARLP